jgi:hypothetical protein
LKEEDLYLYVLIGNIKVFLWSWEAEKKKLIRQEEENSRRKTLIISEQF